MPQRKIEEVAAALRVAELASHGYEDVTPWETVDQERKELFLSMAKAAMEALKVPTEAMLKAGFAASPHDVSGCRDQLQTTDEWTQEAVLGPYQAMLDAALKEGE